MLWGGVHAEVAVEPFGGPCNQIAARLQWAGRSPLGVSRPFQTTRESRILYPLSSRPSLASAALSLSLHATT